MVIKNIIYIIILLSLLLETFIDIREKKIWLPILYFIFPILIGLNLYLGQGNIQLWVGSVGIGGILLFISVITGGQIGRGDAVLFAVMGAGVGLWTNFLLLYMTFLLAFVWGIFLLAVKHVNSQREMPMTPFLLLSYAIWFVKELVLS